MSKSDKSGRRKPLHIKGEENFGPKKKMSRTEHLNKRVKELECKGVKFFRPSIEKSPKLEK